MTRARSPRLVYRGDVAIDGRPVFCIRFCRRSSHGQGANHCVPVNPIDGINEMETIEEIRNALIHAYPLITAPEYGWQAWSDSRPREVAIRDLGPSRYGLAALEGRDLPYIVISPTTFESTREAESRRRCSTVVHELIHLLQFDRPLFRFWYGRRRLRHSDPNWWLHEAAALAAECLVYPKHPPCYPRLWQWATRPELSLESDADGYLAMPFVSYLQRRFGLDFVARLYEATPEQVDSMRAAGVLDWGLRQFDSALVDHASSAKSVFLDYCVDAGMIGMGDTLLDPALNDIVGARAVSDVFWAYPVQQAGSGLPIDHLGCRYFEFYPPPNHGHSLLQIEVSIRREVNNDEKEAAKALQGRLIVVPADGSSAVDQVLVRLPDGRLLGAVPDFSADNARRVLLVLINGAFGPGWAYRDGLQFTVSARLNPSGGSAFA